MEVAAPLIAEIIENTLRVRAQAPKPLQWNIDQSLKLMIRNLERCVQHRVSERAAEQAKQMGLEDLHQMEWRHQPTRMRDKGRKIFHFEHVEQPSDILQSILALRTPEKQEIERLLKRTTLAWILKSENDELPKGPRSNGLELYQEQGIRFVPLSRN